MVFLVLVIPFSRALPNILIIPATLLYLLVLIKSKKLTLSVSWIILLALLLVVLSGALYQNELFSELDFQKKYIAGLWVFLLINQVKNKLLIEYALVMSCTTAILYNIFYFIIKTSSGVEFDLSEGGTVYELLIIHRPYFAFITVLSVYFMLKWIRSGKSRWLYVLAVFTIGFCFFISAKMGILLHLFIIGHHILKSIDQLRPKHLLILFSILILSVIILINNAYMKKRLRVQEDLETTIQKFKEYEIRTIIWDCSWELIKENWVFGVNSHEELVPLLTDCYLSRINPDLKPKKYEYYKTEKFNTHNQFIDIFLLTGVIGLIILLGFFLYPIFKMKIYKETLTILFLFACFLLVENIFQRQLGCFLLGIFLGLYAPREIQLSWSK
jgi:hypothetical protein